jgi:hypothetical protein
LGELGVVGKTMFKKIHRNGMCEGSARLRIRSSKDLIYMEMNFLVQRN